MTNEEAINELRDRYLSISAYVDKKQCDKANKAIDMAIQALEKQIPKKPKTSFLSDFFWCPTCERAIKMKIENGKIYIGFCPFCGQALDFSERSDTDEN